jgi:MFS family permease
MVGGAHFLGFAFSAPASDFFNRYLDRVRGFGPFEIIFLGALSALPFLPMLLWGARWADRRGRKVIGVPSIALGAVFASSVFLVGPPWIWLAGFLGTVVGAPGAAALGVYGPELFPTRVRSGANVLVVLLGVMGSATGLIITGQLSDRLGIGRAVACLVVFPLISAVIVGLFFPETARRELEDTSGEAAS